MLMFANRSKHFLKQMRGQGAIDVPSPARQGLKIRLLHDTEDLKCLVFYESYHFDLL